MMAGQEVRFQALVSSYGAKYVFDESELPLSLRTSKEQELELLYKNIPARCRVVRETNAAGVVYSLRFLNPSGLLLRQIERDITENGIPSPWLRSLPRLNAAAKNLPVPALAVLDYNGEILFLNVKNFTLGGLMLDFSGSALNDVQFGTRFNFDLVTNVGEKINDLSGLITNVAVEVNDVEGHLTKVTFGLRFLPMNPLSESKYRALIKDHCMALKEAPATKG